MNNAKAITAKTSEIQKENLPALILFTVQIIAIPSGTKCASTMAS